MTEPAHRAGARCRSRILPPVPGLSIRELAFDPVKFRFNMPIHDIVDMRRNWGLSEKERDLHASSGWSDADAEYFRRRMVSDGDTFYVLLRGRKPVGMAHVFNFKRDLLTTDLDGVYVVPELRHQGICTWFLNEVLVDYAECHQVVGICLRCHGQGLQNLYSGVGFQVVETIMKWTPPPLRG